jgi:hypothetical protein
LVKQTNPMLDKILAWVVGLEIPIYFGAAVLHLGVSIQLGPWALAVPNTILPATIVETVLGLAVVANLVAVIRGQRPRAVTIGVHLFVLAGVLLGMVSLAIFVGPPPSPDWNLHYVMVAGIAIALVLALRQPRPGSRAGPQTGGRTT